MKDAITIKISTMNELLAYLGRQPYLEVAELIAKIQLEVRENVEAKKNAEEKIEE